MVKTKAKAKAKAKGACTPPAALAVVTVEGGVVQDVRCPKGVRVVVKDYGNEGEGTHKDSEGRMYVRSEYAHDGFVAPETQPAVPPAPVVELWRGFRVDMPRLREQRMLLYALQEGGALAAPDRMRCNDVQETLEGIVELLHGLEDRYDEISGTNAALRQVIALRRAELLKDRRRNDQVAGKTPADACGKAAPADPAGVPADVAVRLLAIRDALCHNDIDAAYHQLYGIADPGFTQIHPWAGLEQAAQGQEDGLSRMREVDSFRERVRVTVRDAIIRRGKADAV